ncbi:MAG: hypothetical protein HY828_13725 [Actinobacteria bacterium]|nr:hypothetical protein [Actinomycetota bacterium]
MDERPPMTLPSALSVLRRFWYIPFGLALLGAAIGLLTVDDSSAASADTSVVLSGDPSVEFLSMTWAPAMKLGPSTDALAVALKNAETTGELGDAVAETDLAVTAPAPDRMSIRVSAASSDQASVAVDAYVSLARQLRQADARQVADDTLESIEAVRVALQDYVDGETSTAQLPADIDLVIVDRGDAAAELVNLGLLEQAARQLREFDGGVTATTSTTDSGGAVVPAVLLAVVFFSLGVVLVLVFGPLDRRVRRVSDIERTTDTPVVAVTSNGSAWPIEAAISRASSSRVWLVAAGRGTATETAQLAGSIDVDGVEVLPAPLGGDVVRAAVGSGEPVFIIVRSGADSARDIRRTDQSLRQAGVVPAGIVLVNVAARDVVAAYT